MHDSPLKQDGQHELLVVYQGKPAETLQVTVSGAQVVIDGPRWHGEGVVTAAGDYIGTAYLRGSFGRAYHVMAWTGERFSGSAYYTFGTEDRLVWVPVR